MKLQELESRTKIQQSLKVFESHFGKSLAIDAMNPQKAQMMLRKVRGLIREHCATSDFHRSEQNPSYLKLIVMEQALASRIKEMADLDEVAPQSMQRAGRAVGQVLGAGIGFALAAIPGAVLGGAALGPAGAVGGGMASGLPGAMTGSTLGGFAGRGAADFTHDALVNAWRKASAKLGGPEATAEFIKAHAQAADYGKDAFAFGGKKYAVTMDRAQARKAMSDLSNMQGSMRESQPGAAPGMAMAQQDPRQAAAAAAGVRKVASATGQGSQANVLGKAIDTAVAGKALDPRQRAALGTQLGGLQKAMSDPATANKLQQMLKTATAMEAKKARRLREASEIQQAQVVLAAQDMVDQVQKMIEQVSAMQFKDLPALVDSIRNDLGMDQAQQFNNDCTAALQGLIQGLQGSKTQLETAQGVLTGQAPMVPGQDAGAAGAAPIPGGALPGADTGDVDMSADLDLDANLPPEDDEELPPAKALGRDRR